MATLQSLFSGNRYKGVRIEAYETGTDVVNNTSTVKVDMYIYSTGYSGSAWGNVNAEIWVAGQYKTIPVPNWNLSGASEKYIGSVEFTVQHEEDGSKWCPFSFSYYPGGDLGGASGESGFSLAIIPRASSVGCSDFYIESSTNIVINSASNNFTHTLKYAFGTLSGTIVEKTAQTIYAWTPNAEAFYQQIPNSSYGVGTITCETYNGTTHIGTKTCNFTARVDTSKNKPNVSLSVVDTNEVTKTLTGNENTLVKYFSNAKAIITASAKNHATIKSYFINNIASEQETTINNVETNKFVAKVVDSRNIDNSSEEVTTNFIDYVKLAFKNILIKRTGPTTDQIRLDLEGFYFDKSFGAVSNELVLKMRYKEEFGEWSEYKTITPNIAENNMFNLLDYNLNTLFDNASFNYQKSYSFQFLANDKLITLDQILPLKRGLPLVAYGENFVHIYGDLEVDGKIYIGENEVLDYDVVEEWEE